MNNTAMRRSFAAAVRG